MTEEQREQQRVEKILNEATEGMTYLEKALFAAEIMREAFPDSDYALSFDGTIWSIDPRKVTS